MGSREGKEAKKIVMDTYSNTHHPDAVHGPIGDEMGDLLIVFDEKRGRFFEAAPEGIVEWPAIIAPSPTGNPEHRWKGMGSASGSHGQHVSSGSHIDTHRAEMLRKHARDVADPVGKHLRGHTGAKIFVAGPRKDRAVLIKTLHSKGVHDIAAELSIPMMATLPQIAARFRACWQEIAESRIPVT